MAGCLLSDKALTWWTSVCRADPSIPRTWLFSADFVPKIGQQFADLDREKRALAALDRWGVGRKESMQDYVRRFQVLILELMACGEQPSDKLLI